jgi:hypothetical protein
MKLLQIINVISEVNQSTTDQIFCIRQELEKKKSWSAVGLYNTFSLNSVQQENKVGLELNETRQLLVSVDDVHLLSRNINIKAKHRTSIRCW